LRASTALIAAGVRQTCRGAGRVDLERAALEMPGKFTGGSRNRASRATTVTGKDPFISAIPPPPPPPPPSALSTLPVAKKAPRPAQSHKHCPRLVDTLRSHHLQRSFASPASVVTWGAPPSTSLAKRSQPWPTTHMAEDRLDTVHLHRMASQEAQRLPAWLRHLALDLRLAWLLRVQARLPVFPSPTLPTTKRTGRAVYRTLSKLHRTCPTSTSTRQ